MRRERDLTTGNITTSLWLFALPLMLGNVMQQLYNLVDTWVVGRYIGDTALAAVGSSYTILTFLTSVIIGLCLGSSAFLSMAYGRRDLPAMRNGIFLSFSTAGALSLCLMLAFYRFLDPIIFFLRVPQETVPDMHTYLFYVFFGFFATFLYNYFSNVLRGIGNSAIPLLFLAVSVVLNIFLDLYCVIVLHWGIMGVALATAASQCVSGIGITVYFLKKVSAVPRDAQRHVLEQRKSPQHSLAVRLYLFAAVCHEFRHSAGARHRQQFRYRRHGCFCRCGKD